MKKYVAVTVATLVATFPVWLFELCVLAPAFVKAAVEVVVVGGVGFMILVIMASVWATIYHSIAS